MRIFCLLLLITIGLIYIAQTAVPITELIVNRVYCNNSLPLLECYTKVQRKNKTSQVAFGNFTIKYPWTNDISCTMIISYQDYSGIWKGLVERTLDKMCENFFGTKGLFVDQRRRFLPDFEEGCPVQPIFYTVPPKTINRYRKDWEQDLKFWIPPYLMEADNWRIYGKYYHKNDSNTIVAELTAEVRLLNERMSQ